MAYDWRRNNVRELRNVVERMVVAADGDILRAEHVPELGGSAGGLGGSAATLGGSAARRLGGSGAEEEGGTYQERRHEAERRIILGALERHDWQITRTAEALGLADHASLLKIMRRLGIRRAGG